MLGIVLKSPRKRLFAAILFAALLAGGIGLLIAQA